MTHLQEMKLYEDALKTVSLVNDGDMDIDQAATKAETNIYLALLLSISQVEAAVNQIGEKVKSAQVASLAGAMITLSAGKLAEMGSQIIVAGATELVMNNNVLVGVNEDLLDGFDRDNEEMSLHEALEGFIEGLRKQMGDDE